MMTSYVKLVRLKIKLMNWYKKTKMQLEAEPDMLREKNAKYFLNMEKRQLNAKVISRLKLENNHVNADPDFTLNEEKTFMRIIFRRT